ncbi:MAG: malto-oligosyltrehalose synthase [Chloroflexota bacterium]|nr:malto-oligosyltrehalose synthase [Chloroflexota bacterium]
MPPPEAAGPAARAAGQTAEAPPQPCATYRLQLHEGFDFAAARELLPYLSRIGVSHVYCSPVLQTAPGSTHGYDVVDPQRVNEALGGEAGWRQLLAAARDAGLGVVLDIVPNHLAITMENPWWWDVLENGRASRFARYFDVDWAPPEPTLRDTVLMPILGDHYGREVEAGALRILRDGGSFRISYHEHRLPVAPRSLDELLAEAAHRAGSDELTLLAASFAALPPSTADDRASVHRRDRDKEVLRKLLGRLLAEQPHVAQAVDDVLEAINADPDRLDALLERQNYRLALWRTAERDLGYRRFFDVTTLAGMRVEDETVFAETHALVLGWLRDGSLDGLRIDHPDGLRDPAEYLDRLRRAAPGTWLVVEKILEPGERLRAWPVAGTTGYDALHRVDGLFVDPAGEDPLTRSYADFTGLDESLGQVVRDGKQLVLHEILGSELNRLTALALRICERHRRHRDHTRHDLHEALREICVSFPVYRSYVRADSGHAAPQDEAVISTAVRDAKARRQDLDGDLFDFLGDILGVRLRGPLESELAMRFQQLTGAVMAKGVEDTAYYRFDRLISLNEVGGDPAGFGVSVDRFHRESLEIQERWPDTMSSSSTHDTKRSEDTRARIHLLSEIPDTWDAAVRRWASMNSPHPRRDMPDRNTEWFLYQTLVGAWPIAIERLQEAMLKSVREQKRHTSWSRPDEAYEKALSGFIAGAYSNEAFCSDLEAFVEKLAQPARITSLAMTLLKLTMPGIPDIYQGTELWDHSLVDPDNRRPVDFGLRQRLAEEAAGNTPEHVISRLAEGLPKLWLIQHALAVRRERPAAFGPEGAYRPLPLDGRKAAHAIGFTRGDQVATVVPRLVMGLGRDWGDTSVDLPAGSWRNVLTGDDCAGGRLPLAGLLARFPVALLVRQEHA